MEALFDLLARQPWLVFVLLLVLLLPYHYQRSVRPDRVELVLRGALWTWTVRPGLVRVRFEGLHRLQRALLRLLAALWHRAEAAARAEFWRALAEWLRRR
ncbi:MAG: hypothetical protein OHK0022_24350 [Roseiflexaceae bacterium]